MHRPALVPHASHSAHSSRRRLSNRRRWPTAAALALALALAIPIAAATPAAASTSASGPQGQTVTVSKAAGLDPDGETITVEGSGFDLNKGIYVVLCVDNGPGQAPSPCLGGADTGGGGGSSAWISSNPPSYGEGLAEPFDEVDGKGSFSVELQVVAEDEFTDCLDPDAAPDGCVVGTRADHTRTADRSADVLVPVTFAAPGSSDDQPPGEQGSDDGDPKPTPPTTDPTAAPTGATSGTAGSDDLAETGTATTAAGVVALLLTIAGGALVALRRLARRTALS